MENSLDLYDNSSSSVGFEFDFLCCDDLVVDVGYESDFLSCEEDVGVDEKGGGDDDVDEKGGGDDVTVNEKPGFNPELLRIGLDRKTIESIISLPRDDNKIHVRCEPLVDILYAQIFTDDADASLDVYGHIKILDLDGPKNFIVYEQDRFDPPHHIYSMHNFLQLSDPGEIPTFNKPLLVVDIKNVHTGAVVAYGQKPLLKATHHPSTPNDFEKLYTLQFQGDARGGGLVDTGARVELQCVAFTFGVHAEVQIFLYKDDDDDDASKSQKNTNDEQGVEVFGLICAKCNPLLLPKDCYENHMFNVIREDHEWVGLGTEIVLSKSLVAVPTYSNLEISLDLRGYEDDGFIVQGTASFEPSNHSGGKKIVRGVNGFYVRVHVEWFEPSLLSNFRRKEDIIDDFCSVPHWPDRFYASHLLEVFSLFIARPKGEDVNLYGSVNIRDSKGSFDIFSCSKNEAYFLPRGCNLLPLQGPKRAVTPMMYFFMKIDLRDVDGRVKIKGYVKSCNGIDESQRPWFDRRLCSVIRGADEKSFAAINYTLFSFAVQANLRVYLVFKCRPSAHVKIFGDITAFYDKLSYSTIYDVEFFRRVLFTRKKANFLEVEDNVELSRYVVAVPMTFSLLTKINLSFQTNVGTHRVGGLVKFRIGELSRSIKSDFVDICFDVDWKFLPFP